MKTNLFLFIWLLMSYAATAQQSLHFSSWDSLITYAEQHSYTGEVGKQQQLFAKMQRLAAIGNTVNPRVPTTFSLIDNTELPVSFIPAEIFGGPSGTFRELTMGQEYISTFTLAPQFDIFNPTAISKIKSAKISEDMTAVSNLITKKSILESVNACYHNILSLQQQQALLKKNLVVADSISLLVKTKYELGAARSQELNEATVNSLNLQDKIEQIDYNIKQQLLALQLLCDLPANTEIAIDTDLQPLDSFNLSASANSELSLRYAQLQHSFAKAENKAAHWAHLPTISFVSSLSWQNNSNERFFDKNSRWINSNYWGLRLTYNLPTDVQKLTNESTTHINLKIAALQLEHSKLQNEINNRQLENDYAKAQAAIGRLQQILALKQDNYQKSRNQYEADILPLDKLLLAYNDLLISELNLLNAWINLQYAQSKIAINNRIP